MLILGPLWFLNFILIILNFILISFLGLTYSPLKYDFNMKNIKINEISLPRSQVPVLSDILDRDFFNTRSPVEVNEKIFVYQPTTLVNEIFAPMVPEKIQIMDLPLYEQEVLPPLQIILRGTIISDYPLHNKVFIENLRTKEEKDYIIGDIVEDAQIVFIGKSQVNLIRSNGQEEIIYLNKSLKIEEEAINKLSWNQVCFIKNDMRLINTHFFVLKIKSLAMFIDILGLITYFEENVPKGCIITEAHQDSLAYALGFLNKDIILSINDIPLNTVESRVKAYEFIMNNKKNKDLVIKVKLLRNNSIIEILFQLYNDLLSSANHIGVLNLKEVDNYSKQNHKEEEKLSFVYNSNIKDDSLHKGID